MSKKLDTILGKMNVDNYDQQNKLLMIKKIKWQLHAEMSIIEILLFIIIGKLFDGGWMLYIVLGIMIIGSLYGVVKSSKKLGIGYLNY